MENAVNALGGVLGKLAGGNLLPVPQTHEGHCPKHGAYRSKTFFKHVLPECPHCLDERYAEKLLAQQKADAETSRQRFEAAQRQALCEHTDIPPRFADKTVKGWLPESGSEQAVKNGVAAYAKRLRDGNRGSLVLHGNLGTGKTHLACALLAMVKRDLGGSVQYLTAADLFRKLRDSQNFKAAANESAVLAFYENFDLLAVDEVGNQTGGDKERVLLGELLNRRYAKMKPTVVVSNLGVNDLARFLGQVAWERLMDGGVRLAFDGKSRRKPLDWGAA